MKESSKLGFSLLIFSFFFFLNSCKISYCNWLQQNISKCTHRFYRMQVASRGFSLCVFANQQCGCQKTSSVFELTNDQTKKVFSRVSDFPNDRIYPSRRLSSSCSIVLKIWRCLRLEKVWRVFFTFTREYIKKKKIDFFLMWEERNFTLLYGLHVPSFSVSE